MHIAKCIFQLKNFNDITLPNKKFLSYSKRTLSVGRLRAYDDRIEAFSSGYLRLLYDQYLRDR